MPYKTSSAINYKQSLAVRNHDPDYIRETITMPNQDKTIWLEHNDDHDKNVDHNIDKDDNIDRQPM